MISTSIRPARTHYPAASPHAVAGGSTGGRQACWLARLNGGFSMTRYVALVDGRSGTYGLTVPDLPGCTSAAATIDEVLRRATEAVRLWAEDALMARNSLSHARSRRFVPIPKWLRHWRTTLCSRLCRSS